MTSINVKINICRFVNAVTRLYNDLEFELITKCEN